MFKCFFNYITDFLTEFSNIVIELFQFISFFLFHIIVLLLFFLFPYFFNFE